MKIIKKTKVSELDLDKGGGRRGLSKDVSEFIDIINSLQPGDAVILTHPKYHCYVNKPNSKGVCGLTKILNNYPQVKHEAYVKHHSDGVDIVDSNNVVVWREDE